MIRVLQISTIDCERDGEFQVLSTARLVGRDFVKASSEIFDTFQERKKIMV